jgi:hypothetical protein
VGQGPHWSVLQVSGGQFKKSLINFSADSALKHSGQLREINPLYVLLASEESTYTTGNIWRSDGFI